MNTVRSAVFSASLLLALFFSGGAGGDWRLSCFKLQRTVLDGASMPFVAYSGEGKFDNWVGLNLPLEPVRALKTELEEAYRVKLQSRPEAHITVVTPPEYWVLEKHLKIGEINAMVAKEIQKSSFSVSCLGVGEAAIDGKIEKTFFIVVQSSDLLALREKIHELFVQKGGDAAAFKPAEYFPHITVGYTRDDLHIDQGVIKDVRSCRANLRLYQ